MLQTSMYVHTTIIYITTYSLFSVIHMHHHIYTRIHVSILFIEIIIIYLNIHRNHTCTVSYVSISINLYYSRKTYSYTFNIHSSHICTSLHISVYPYHSWTYSIYPYSCLLQEYYIHIHTLLIFI